MDISDRAEVLGRLEATSRWLHLVAGQLAEQGADVEAIGLLEQARVNIIVVCHRLASAETLPETAELPVTSGDNGPG